MKKTWNGSLVFGLVTIDVELYSAVKAHAVSFTLLHEKCKKPISYHRWCQHCDQEVAWQDIVKGIPRKDGSFFVVTTEQLKALKPSKNPALEIVEFVAPDAIDPVLYDTHYYVIPAHTPYQPFFLFAQAMANLDKVAIGSLILRDKQHVVAIRPYKGILLLSTLNYAYQIKQVTKLEEIKAPKADAKELALAEEIIGKLSHKTFDIRRFEDVFATNLVKMVSRAHKKGAPRITSPKKIGAKKKKPSLMSSLEASLARVGQRSRTRKNEVI